MKQLLTLYCILLSAINLFAQGDIHERSQQYVWPTETKVVEKLHEWQDLKFGVLIHWGIYSVPGIVESWSIADEDWITRDTTQTFQQYQNWYFGLANEFNPTEFNPDEWANVMKEAGMKYVIFTTKHHDGFCMFDSKYSDYTISKYAFKNNPKKDVLKYVFESFRSNDFMIGAYYSKPDWHSQYYWWDVYSKHNRNVNYPIDRHPWRWEQFKKFTHNQIEEIVSRYGKIDILWFDGGWVCKENNQDIGMPTIANMARRYQPGVLIVDRTIHGEYENYQTPERTIPENKLDYPWESCITLSDNWGWVKSPNWKSPSQISNFLIEIVAKGGNLVLGVGPTAQGTVEYDAIIRLKEIGKWLKENGKAIYSTTSLEKYNDKNIWFTYSKISKKTYAIYTLEDGDLIPNTVSWEGNLPKKGSKINLLCNGKTLKYSIKNNQIKVTIPKNIPHKSFAIEYEM